VTPFSFAHYAAGWSTVESLSSRKIYQIENVYVSRL